MLSIWCGLIYSTWTLYKKVKVCFYVVQYPVRWTAQSTVHFTPWQTCSFRHQLDFSRKHSIHAVITREGIFIFLPPSISRYSFIHLSWGNMERIKMPELRNGSKGDSNPGSLDCESGILTLIVVAQRYSRVSEVGSVH